jgi:hypothetical protein
MVPVPRTAVADLDVAGAHRRLLGAYAQVISMVNALPFLVRVPLAESELSWWWIGAPRPVIGGLVAAHVRKRLRALGEAHIRAAVLADGGAARRMLREASQECQELAATLHLWVPKTCAAWADALGIAVGSVKRLGVGRPVLARPEVG